MSSSLALLCDIIYLFLQEFCECQLHACICISTLVEARAMVMKNLVGVRHWIKLLPKFLVLNLPLFEDRFHHFIVLFLYRTGFIGYFTYSHPLPVFLRYSCHHLCFVCIPKAWWWGKFSASSRCSSTQLIINFWHMWFLWFWWFYYMFRLIMCQLLAVAGAPYDTLEEVIGIRDSNGLGSLRDFGIDYREVPVCFCSFTYLFRILRFI